MSGLSRPHVTRGWGPTHPHTSEKVIGSHFYVGARRVLLYPSLGAKTSKTPTTIELICPLKRVSSPLPHKNESDLDSKFSSSACHPQLDHPKEGTLTALMRPSEQLKKGCFKASVAVGLKQGSTLKRPHGGCESPAKRSLEFLRALGC